MVSFFSFLLLSLSPVDPRFRQGAGAICADLSAAYPIAMAYQPLIRLTLWACGEFLETAKSAVLLDFWPTSTEKAAESRQNTQLRLALSPQTVNNCTTVIPPMPYQGGARCLKDSRSSTRPSGRGRAGPTAWESIPSCFFPSAGHRPAKPKRCAEAASCGQTAWSMRWRTAKSSVSGVGSPSVNAERCVAPEHSLVVRAGCSQPDQQSGR